MKGDKSNRGWIASRYVGNDDKRGYSVWGIYSVYNGTYETNSLYLSNNEGRTLSYGLRPVISISANLLDISNSSTDGASASTAWNIK